MIIGLPFQSAQPILPRNSYRKIALITNANCKFAIYQYTFYTTKKVHDKHLDFDDLPNFHSS